MPDSAALPRPPLRPTPLPARAEQFDDLDQQTEIAHLGMWLFLGTELLFFGALFAAYTVYRFTYPHVFAEASRELMMWAGAGDTAILIVSSFCVAMAVHTAQNGGSRGRLTLLLLTGAALGGGFLVLHGYEYYRDITEHHFPGGHFVWEGHAPGNKAMLFFTLYFLMTGLHSFHVLIGVGVLLVMAFQAWGKKFTPDYYTPVEVSGLYWHFVDLIWVFLFPLFYLIAPR